MPSKAVRNASKKLRNFESKNQGVRNERYEELYRCMIKAKVAVAITARNEANKSEYMKIKRLTDDEFLNMAFKQNAGKNAENKRLEKLRLEEAIKHAEFNKQFYNNVLQPAIAKNIIMSIVEGA